MHHYFPIPILGIGTDTGIEHSFSIVPIARHRYQLYLYVDDTVAI